jgi:protein-disulfide isomerase
MHRRITPNLILGLLLGAMLWSPAIQAATPTPAEEIKALHQDIDALKESQQAIGRDVAEIKKLLQAMQPPPRVRPTDAVIEMGNSPMRGKRDARLTLIEFSDYQCPFCQRHVQTTLPQLEKEYIATGKLRYVFRDFPLDSIHPQAPKAAEAAHCASDQGKYWEMHAKLFSSQQALESDRLAEYAEALGLKVDSFKTCLSSGKYADSVRRDRAEGEKLGMSGTPTLLLGISNGNQVKLARLIVGAQPFSVFKEEIDKLLDETPGKK